jgi:hypothetical protein
MKKLLFSFITLIVLLIGCSQDSSPEEIADIAYKWEKAKYDRDYKKEQKFIYEKGSYEVHKTAKKVNSGLKYEDIRFEIYYDKELEQYYVLADFDNPNGDNAVEENVVFREKDDMWKVDISKSSDIVRDEIRKEFKREACIHCK